MMFLCAQALPIGGPHAAAMNKQLAWRSQKHPQNITSMIFPNVAFERTRTGTLNAAARKLWIKSAKFNRRLLSTDRVIMARDSPDVDARIAAMVSDVIARGSRFACWPAGEFNGVATFMQKYTCSVCHKGFVKAANLVAHMLVHNVDTSFACTECARAYRTRSSLVAHMRVHAGDNLFACTECDKSFPYRSRLATHRRTHTGERPFSCKLCDAKFGRQWSLTAHERTHTGAKPHQCRACDRSFSQSGGLASHAQTHTGEKPHVCPTCDAAFGNRWYLANHQRIHTDERHYACDQCDMSFIRNYSLKIHKRVHIGEKPFVCGLCGKGFVVSTNLRVHERIHKPEKAFVCATCGKSFKQRPGLRAHSRRHTGSRPFACNHCNKSFCETGDLCVHERVHSGQHPFVCLECGKSFAQSGNMARHHRNHELKRDWEFVCPYEEFTIAVSSDVAVPVASPSSRRGVLCAVRCKTRVNLDYHVQAAHSRDGLEKRMLSESKLAAFFDSQDVPYFRDQDNALSHHECDAAGSQPLVDLTRFRSRPDFYLYARSAVIGALVIVENDEHQHRSSHCKDMQRMQAIAATLGLQTPQFRDMPIVFVRFNPHHYTRDGVLFDPSLESRHAALLSLVSSELPSPAPAGLSLVYMYYDCTTNPQSELELDCYSAANAADGADVESIDEMRRCIVRVIG